MIIFLKILALWFVTGGLVYVALSLWETDGPKHRGGYQPKPSDRPPQNPPRRP